MKKKVSFSMTLYDDDSVRKKLTVMDKMEVLFDDARNEEPDAYYDIIENMPLGSTMQITIEVIE